ncbi:trypsin-like serine protease [Burkholderia vietnamiensis]|uniref:trypsin-like serine protease n=1 Tax=Burkholderia vietnamiensis TaxID=60552 RepID=UPI00158CE84D|nr:trypsin-like serine protease [Burkholderia vietnamiensis]
MKKIIVSAGLAALVASSAAHALRIDEATFKYYGGDSADLANSIKTHNDQLRAFSYETPWLAVGEVGGCTATWLGDNGGWTYVLTAAHCAGYQGTETAVTTSFTTLDRRAVASGRGTAYVPPQRINKPAGMGGASTDIAILKLPTLHPIADVLGKPVERPILNDDPHEKDRDVIFVGYGSWGVGAKGSGSYWPANGERRLYGRSRIDSIFELGYGIGASYRSAGPSPFWTRTASGDSGSAWWQIRDGKPVIIATTNGGGDNYSTGARVSKYVDWIKSVYPEARFLSAEQPAGCIVSLQTAARYCLPVGQRSGYALPSWIYAHDVFVDAAPGTAVMLSDWDNLSYNRIATFVGTVENGGLKQVKAVNGQVLDFSRPHSMRVERDTTPLGCIVSLTSGAKYCLPAGQRSGRALPSWIYANEVQVEAAAGIAVMLSDTDDLAFNRVATFTGLTQNWELKKAKAWNGEDLDFSRPKSMRVVQQ